MASTMTPRSRRSCRSASDFIGSATFGFPHLFDAGIQAEILRGEIEKLLHVGLEKRLGHAMAGAVIGSENKIGTGAAHFLFRGFLRYAGRQMKSRVGFVFAVKSRKIVSVGSGHPR